MPCRSSFLPSLRAWTRRILRCKQICYLSLCEYGRFATCCPRANHADFYCDIPPLSSYVVACLFTVAVGFFCDRRGHRAFVNLCLLPISIVGYIILLTVNPAKTPGASYFACYVVAMFFPCIPNTIALTGSHVEGIYKKSVVIGTVISWGNIHGAATSQVYIAKQAPRYPTGHGVIIAYLGVAWICTVLYYARARFENAKRDKGECDEVILDHLPEAEAERVAAEKRARQLQEVKAAGGIRNRIKAFQMKIHAAPGGTYASVAEARRLKGDDYSGHRECRRRSVRDQTKLLADMTFASFHSILHQASRTNVNKRFRLAGSSDAMLFVITTRQCIRVWPAALARARAP